MDFDNAYYINQLPFHFESLQLNPPKIAISPIIQSVDLFSIVEYFNKYGSKDNKWDLGRGKSGDFYIVQFACIEDAEAVLKKRYHRIKKYIFSVAEYDSSIAVNEDSAAGDSFLRATPKHWHKILNYLDVVDLCAAANACTQLKTMGEHVFSSKFDKITWRAGNKNANDIFNTFGHLISILDVDIVEPCSVHFDRIVSKCSNNLRNLTIWMNDGSATPLNLNTQFGLSALFSQLCQLKINCRTFFDHQTAMQLFLNCSSLESLAINCTSTFDSVCNNINVQFGQLNEIKLELNATINDIGLELLLTCNPAIKKLYIDECPRLTSKSIEIIACCVPWLEELSLGPLKNYCQMDLRPFGKLYCLKSVQILLDPAMPLMNVIYGAGIPIERLELWYVDVTGTLIEQLTSMRSIKDLTIFSYTVTNDHLKMIANKLPMLTELRLAGSKYVTVDGLLNMLYSAQSLTVLRLNNIENINDKQYLQTLVKRNFHGKPSIEVENF